MFNIKAKSLSEQLAELQRFNASFNFRPTEDNIDGLFSEDEIDLDSDSLLFSPSNSKEQEYDSLNISSKKELFSDNFLMLARLSKAVSEGKLTEEEAEIVILIANHKEDLTSKIRLSKSKFETINEVIFGPLKDTKLKSRLDKIGKRYGTSIRFDNNLMLESTGKSSFFASGKTISEEEVQAVEDALAQMDKMGQEIPPVIYLTDLFEDDGDGITVGVFCRKNSNSIAINIGVKRDLESMKGTIYHESAHYADYKLAKDDTMAQIYNKDYLSDSCPRININKESEYFGDGKTEKVSAASIEKYISYYALKNNHEFVAEITRLITNETIVKNRRGKYVINPAKIENGCYKNAKNVKTEWNGKEKEIEDLNKIMKLYEKLSKNKITKATVIR